MSVAQASFFTRWDDLYILNIRCPIQISVPHNLSNFDVVKADRDISNIMRKVRGANTSPELIFRKALWAKGLRYNIDNSTLPGKPDIVLPSRRIAIFIDGDFWHGMQWKRRKLASLEEQFVLAENRSYWLKKIRGNMRRDSIVTAKLLSEGWKVLRFWESDVRNNLDKCLDLTVKTIGGAFCKGSEALLPNKTVAEFFAGIGLMRLGLELQD